MTTLTKRMSEDLTDYLQQAGVRVRYLHSDIDAIERVEILRGLRLGDFDVLVGINLLREGLDLPEVSLVAILDADQEGFLRSDRSLIQTVRPRGPESQRAGRPLRRPDHRIDAAGARRDGPPPQAPAGLQRGPRHHARLRSSSRSRRRGLSTRVADARMERAPARKRRLPPARRTCTIRPSAPPTSWRSSGRCARRRPTWSSSSPPCCATRSTICARRARRMSAGPGPGCASARDRGARRGRAARARPAARGVASPVARWSGSKARSVPGKTTFARALLAARGAALPGHQSDLQPGPSSRRTARRGLSCGLLSPEAIPKRQPTSTGRACSARDLLLVEWPERGGAWVPPPVARGLARLRWRIRTGAPPDRRGRVTVRVAIDATSDRLSIALGSRGWRAGVRGACREPAGTRARCCP